jgi:hypothetical protein
MLSYLLSSIYKFARGYPAVLSHRNSWQPKNKSLREGFDMAHLAFLVYYVKSDLEKLHGYFLKHEKNGIRLEYVINTLELDVQGMIITRKRNNFTDILVIYCGTNSWADGTKVLVDCLPSNCGTDVSDHTNCASNQRATIHEGVQRAFDSQKDDLREQLLKILSKIESQGNKLGNVYTVGHSLGAAMAHFSSPFVHSVTGRKPRMYGFGAPRMGNSVYESIVAKHCSRVALFANEYDFITFLPMFSLQNYSIREHLHFVDWHSNEAEPKIIVEPVITSWWQAAFGSLEYRLVFAHSYYLTFSWANAILAGDLFGDGTKTTTKKN